MIITAIISPVVFARTSKISALLVVVNNSCEISIPIPKTNENKTANIKGLNMVFICNCLLKNKNQKKVNAK